MSLGENIKDAFEVVLKTYENVDRLIKYCDVISRDYGYEPVTEKFLRYKSDSNYEGWVINSFIKLYQSNSEKILENGWKEGPVFAMEINFVDQPTVYLSKFLFEDMSTLMGKVSPSDYWLFTEPIDCLDNGFTEVPIEGKEDYRISTPKNDIKSRYWNIDKVVYAKIDLLKVTSNNMPLKIFGEFDILKTL